MNHSNIVGVLDQVQLKDISNFFGKYFLIINRLISYHTSVGFKVSHRHRLSFWFQKKEKW